MSDRTKPDQREPDGRVLALAAARAAAEKQAEGVLVLDVRGPIVITDYFVIASAETDRQAKTVADEIQRTLKEMGASPARREGEVEGRWILLDYVDVVVHVFGKEEREFYGLERLWSDALPVDWESRDAASSG
ncbi:MAG: ribosome silencing factor [Actinomycetota bacterium]